MLAIVVFVCRRRTIALRDADARGLARVEAALGFSVMMPERRPRNCGAGRAAAWLDDACEGGWCAEVRDLDAQEAAIDDDGQTRVGTQRTL